MSGHTNDPSCPICQTNSPNYCRVWFGPGTPLLSEKLVVHRYDGLCPDEVEGWDARDPLCETCQLLDRLVIRS